jgi:hypothetical protein
LGHNKRYLSSFWFWAAFSCAYLQQDSKKNIGITGSNMTRLAALLIATTAITGATQAFAGGFQPDQDQPFFWTDLSADEVESSAPEPKVPTSVRPATFAVDQPTDAPLAPASQPKTPRQNPIMETYPVAQAPQNAVPQVGAPRYLDEDCYPAQTMPNTDLITHTPRPSATGQVATAENRRRGEMMGDDGVVEAIQDTPCTYIHRRGGETADSARGYTNPEDIRRVNTLEERRIPVHDVGRYAPEGSDSWASDGSNPYIDTSRTWTIERGRMVSEVLIEWGEISGWDVIWHSSHDFVVQADVTIRGTFPEAAGKVIDSFYNANPPIAGDLYPSNRVLVVDSAAAFDGR